MARIDINQARIASPCNMLWSQMKGDNRVRHCGACKLNVYNVAGMTKAEAEDLLQTAAMGERVCMRLSRRADGTIITKDCPVGVSLARRMKLKMAAIRFSALSMLSAMLWTAGLSKTADAGEAGGISVEANFLSGDVAVAPVETLEGEVAVLPSKGLVDTGAPKMGKPAVREFSAKVYKPAKTGEPAVSEFTGKVPANPAGR